MIVNRSQCEAEKLALRWKRNECEAKAYEKECQAVMVWIRTQRNGRIEEWKE